MFKKFYETGSLWGGVLLVAGTTIGGGMLGVPVSTAGAGFVPSLILYFLSWAFMLSTAYLLVEVYLWFPDESNYISMAQRTLGKFGAGICWALYLFFFFSILVAYLSGGGGILAHILHLTPTIGPFVFVLIFAPFVYLGTASVDRLNTWLMGGLFLTFFLFLALGVQYLQPTFLERADWGESWKVAPILFTAFGFHGMVPTLITYLARDAKKVKRAIFYGSLIPFICYVLWQAVILGVVPFPALQETAALGESAIYPLRKITNIGILSALGEALALFCIITSFLGVALGLRDFLSDGLHLRKKGGAYFLVMLGIFLLPLTITAINPCLFLNALNYGGGIGSALLLGLYPIVMVLSGRYFQRRHGVRLLAGGRAALALLLLFLICQFGMIFLK